MKVQVNPLVRRLCETFAWHPELFDYRGRVLEALDQAGFEHHQDFESVDLLHDEYGVEIVGIPDESLAAKMLGLLARAVPELPVRFNAKDRNGTWVATAVRDDEQAGIPALRRRRLLRVAVGAPA